MLHATIYLKQINNDEQGNISFACERIIVVVQFSNSLYMVSVVVEDGKCFERGLAK